MPKPIIGVEVIGVQAMLTNLTYLIGYSEAAADRITKVAADALAEKEKEFAAESRWTGNLIESIVVNRAGIAEYTVGPTAPYAAYVEYGGRPHAAPIEKLEAWASEHGMTAGQLYHKILVEGTEAEPFVAPAMAALRGENLAFRLGGFMSL